MNLKKAAEVSFPAPPHLLTIPDLTAGSQCVEKMNHFHLQFEQTGVLAVLKGFWYLGRCESVLLAFGRNAKRQMQAAVAKFLLYVTKVLLVW